MGFKQKELTNWPTVSKQHKNRQDWVPNERRACENMHETLSPGALGYRITNTSHPTASGQTYKIVKLVIQIVWNKFQTLMLCGA